MKITYNENPLKTIIELDDQERDRLRDKATIEELSDLLFDVHYAITEAQDLSRAIILADPKYYTNDNTKTGLEERIDEIVFDCIESLAGEHCGDCTCVPASCLKCYAESLLGINTIEGLGKHAAAMVVASFSNRNIDGAIEYLRTLEPRADWHGWEAHAERWRQEADRAYQWLLNYRDVNFKPPVAARA